MAALLVSCSASTDRAAEALCPVMWDWVRDMGDTFNDMASEAVSIPDPDTRRDRYRAGFDQMRSLIDGLVGEVSALGADVPSQVVADIEAGVLRSLAEIDDLDGLLDEHPDLDEMRPQARISEIIVRVEKVIDLPKPEMASYDDPELLAAFRREPSCQHGVKDVDDGTPRAVP